MRRELSIGKKIFFTVIVSIAIVVIIFLIFRITIGTSLGKMQEENAELEAQIETLQDYVVNMDTYLVDTDKYASDIENIIQDYEKTTTAASLLHNYETIFKEHGLESSALSFQDPEVLNSVSYSYNNESYNYDLQKTQIAITYKDTYDGLMLLIAELNNNKSNSCITSINMSPDTSDGNIMGSMNIIKYTINDGSGEQNEETDLDLDIEVGTDKVFDVPDDINSRHKYDEYVDQRESDFEEQLNEMCAKLEAEEITESEFKDNEEPINDDQDLDYNTNPDASLSEETYESNEVEQDNGE